VTAVTLPVSLAAAAETLRAESAKWRAIPCHEITVNQIAAVADLIDGTLGEHYRATMLDDQHMPGDCCGTCESEEWPCPTVELLVPLVRAFLPDWNPDTEEAP
jgi:hypothetical protein